MVSGGAGAWRSRGSREARPKPVSQTWPVAELTSTLAGLRSLWTSPRWWTCPKAAAMPTANCKKRPTSMGAPSKRSSGSPPGSSSTSMVRPRSRTSSSGRTAQELSSASLKLYSRARRSRLAGVGGSAAGHTASTAFRWPLGSRCQPRTRTRSPSCPKSWKLLSLSVPNWKDRFNGSTPRSSGWPLSTNCATMPSPKPASPSFDNDSVTSGAV